MIQNKVVANVGRWPVLCKDARNSLLDRNLLLEETRGELLHIAEMTITRFMKMLEHSPHLD